MPLAPSYSCLQGSAARKRCEGASRTAYGSQKLRLLYDEDDEQAMLQLADEWDALEQRPEDSHRDPSQNELRGEPPL